MPSPSPYTLDTAKLDWTNNQPSTSQYDDIYFAKDHGLNESQYVFLENNHLTQRWKTLAPNSLFTIGETGFGTGLNFLSTWQLWLKTAPETSRLHYISVEKHPLTLNDIERALSNWPELKPLSEQLVKQYPVLTPGQHLLQFDEGNVSLHLLLGEAQDSFEQLRCSNNPNWQDSSSYFVNAWFLDGFAPSKNPDLWNNTLYSLIADLSSEGTTLATFTAAGNVRRDLATHGFVIEKAPGYGKKREMLRGYFEPKLRKNPVVIPRPKNEIKAPWNIGHSSIKSSNVERPLDVVIVGGGLAGTSSAYSLARRGCNVTLVEREKNLAAGASGNPQAMLYTKLSARTSTLNQFNLSSYLFALRYYQQWKLNHNISGQDANFCGVLQLIISERDKKNFTQIDHAFSTHEQLVKLLNAEQATDIAGIDIKFPSFFFPNAGWISPTVVCKSQASHRKIKTQLENNVVDIVRKNNRWLLLDEDEHSIIDADIVIIANSKDAQRFTDTSQLPLKNIRGQISQLQATPVSEKLATVVCHEGYITPAINSFHSLGATYSLDDSDISIRTEDHKANLRNVNQALPDLNTNAIKSIDISSMKGRASLRCSTPDYLPLVGPVHNHSQFIQDYAGLRKNALIDTQKTGSYYSGLYINVGHGSRGLTSTPICSELLAATICNEPPPLPRKLIQALNPGRFLIRDLIRNKC